MEYGIVQASYIPVRKDPDSTSEMTSQLLFGEIFEVLDRNEQWQLVRNRFDGYEGWISPEMTSRFTDDALGEYEAMESVLVKERFCSLRAPEGTLLVPAGSVLYYHAGDPRHILCGKTYELDRVPGKPAKDKGKALGDLKGELLNIPYLWGGKSSYGTDCSGLVQTICRILDVPLLRDASQQVGQGKTVNMMTESGTGDLVFFDDEEGEIVHTGIITGPGEILHASGCVKTDAIDHQGIYSMQLGKYTHRLRVIKRVI
ncbi:MAG: hypothetical protein AMS23_00875 [Bacteroides sp. SM1_62]|nr:MAG: hypothetical protein AMS26_13015 [Bacteroides sp. SM23_62]KPL26661.1 MAG: hypothetical protein AMS23_00875 [Bacteroides sp. SM1_62]